MTTEQTRSFLEGVFGGWRDTADQTAWIDALDEDLVWTVTGSGPTAGVHEGKRAYVDGVLSQVNEWLQEPLVPKVERLIIDGDSAAALLKATARGKDGSEFVMTYCWMIRVADHKVVEVVGFYATG